MSDWKIQYWDSPLFLVYVSGRDQPKIAIINGLLDLYDKNSVEIVISTYVIAEVRSIPEDDSPTSTGNQGLEAVSTVTFTPEEMERVQKLFESPQLDYRVLTPRIASHAAEIGNRFPRLLPPDCVHIATALEANADVLFTWDGAGRRRRPGDMLRYDGMIDGLRIMQPFVPMGPLFDPSRAQS